MWILPAASRTILAEWLDASALYLRVAPTGVVPWGKTYTHARRVARTTLWFGAPSQAVHVTGVGPMGSGAARSWLTRRPPAPAASSSSRNGEAVGAISINPGSGSSTASGSGRTISAPATGSAARAAGPGADPQPAVRAVAARRARARGTWISR